MAVYNEILVGRFNRFLQKYLSMKGEPPARQLSTEIMAVFPLELGQSVELRTIGGWTRYAIAYQVGPVAAVNSGFRFRMPAAANVVAVFEKLQFQSTVADTAPALTQAPTATDLSTPKAGQRLDPRGNTNSALIISAQTTTPALVGPPIATIWQGDIPAAPAAGSLVDIVTADDQELTVLPGDALQFATSAVNTTLYLVSAIWRERQLEESERT